ncbi:unnamed protein product [Moneuplotes crassus]|uniref:Uncharacterized protein n=1 Tax=Euplotes crassus TaxID=5936 RepID=A0AAD1UKT1_EUPCR|nr:unnamed protein product [Moneuplotes crassus]
MLRRHPWHIYSIPSITSMQFRANCYPLVVKRRYTVRIVDITTLKVLLSLHNYVLKKCFI